MAQVGVERHEDAMAEPNEHLTDGAEYASVEDPPVPTFVRQRLLLFLDGTWNLDDGTQPPTHIVRLRNMVDETCFRREGVNWYQRVYYDTGVGTGPLDRWLGGLAGVGLDRNIVQAYRFLSQHYRPTASPQPTDEIAVFGFSRGAFTARSLVGFVGAAGLLRAEHCTDDNLKRAWEYYRTPEKERSPGEKAALAALCQSGVRVRVLGVFDTVGALGIPGKFLLRINKYRFQFHDTELSSIVDYAFHALALDEQRQPFEAAVWQQPRHRFFRRIEQVWFPGVHADVGGGYVQPSAGEPDLSLLPLQWMVERLRSRDLVRFNQDDAEHLLSRDLTDAALAPQHDSRSTLYRVLFPKPLLRIVDQTIPEARRGSGYKINQFMAHQRPIRELVHWSTLDRLGKQIEVVSDDLSGVRRTMIYSPLSARLVLPRLIATYRHRANAHPFFDAFVALWSKENPEVAARPLHVVRGERDSQTGLMRMRELDPNCPSASQLVIDKLDHLLIQHRDRLFRTFD